MNRYANSRDWKRTSKEIRRRNPFCESCGVSGEHARLNVHHVVPVAELEEWTSEWNQYQVLCASCHSKLHNPKKSEMGRQWDALVEKTNKDFRRSINVRER